MRQEEFEDTKRGNRTEYINQRRTENTMIKKSKRTNNDLKNITQKTKDRTTRTPLKHCKPGDNQFVLH